MKQNLLITNPLSGKYKKDKILNFIKEIQKIGLKIIKIELEKNQFVKEIIDNINPDEFDTIFLAFGDGTINSTINAIANRDDFYKFKICVLPFGTANVLANEVGLNTIHKVVTAIKKKQIKKLHLGKTINLNNGSTRYFSLMVSSGFDSLTVSKVDENTKNKLGKSAYIKKLYETIKKEEFTKLQTQIGSRKYENILTCVSNGKYYGGKIHVTDSKLEDNNFDVIIIKKFNIKSMIDYMITKKTNKNIIKLKAKNITITSDNQNHPYQIDGDCYGNLPIRVEATDKFINIIYL